MRDSPDERYKRWIEGEPTEGDGSVWDWMPPAIKAPAQRKWKGRRRSDAVKNYPKDREPDQPITRLQLERVKNDKCPKCRGGELDIGYECDI